MAYQPNIPRPTDQLNDSQGDIQENFQEIFNLIGVNHFEFDTANEGKHTQVTLPVNVAPTPTGLDELNIYSRISANTNALELTWQRANAGAITEMTAARVEPANPRNGWSRTASGLLLKWGVGTINNFLTPTVITYPLNINGVVAPVFNTVFTVLLTSAPTIAAGGSVVFLDGGAPIGPLNFTAVGQSVVILSTTPFNFYYLAIGS